MQLVKGAEVWVATTGSVTSAAIGHIDVVFAGGGAGIEFLRKALPRSISVKDGRTLAVRVRTDDRGAVRSATEGRLAVARGGVTDEDLWPTDVLKVPNSIRGLGPPPQVVGSWTA